MRMRHWILLIVGGMVLFGCGLPGAQTQETPVLEAAADKPVPTIQPTESATATIEPEPTIAPAYYVFPPYGIAGLTAWIVEGGEATRLTLPELAYNQFDHSPQTGRLLHPSRFPTRGGGPANLSVGDLWIYNIASQTDELIFQEENVVEAMWAPDGQGFVYLKATETSYELRYHTAQGEDWLVVEGAAPVFSVSPDGQWVAFTRETGYQVGEPGLYVVPVSGGEARKISSVDRQGAGSIADIPLWSPDSRFILLPCIPRLRLAALVPCSCRRQPGEAVKFWSGCARSLPATGFQSRTLAAGRQRIHRRAVAGDDGPAARPGSRRGCPRPGDRRHLKGDTGRLRDAVPGRLGNTGRKTVGNRRGWEIEPGRSE